MSVTKKDNGSVGVYPQRKEIKYATWGKSRSNRLAFYDYSSNRPIHITICTYNKRDFFNSETNAQLVITELLKTTTGLNFKIFCYCLMPDHLHIVLSPGNSLLPLSKFLSIFKGRTTAIFRKSNGSTNLWQRSAFDHIIRRVEDLKDVIEYILNNPVRKGITERAEDYPYSKSFDTEIQRYL